MPDGKSIVFVCWRDDLDQTTQFGFRVQRHAKKFYTIQRETKALIERTKGKEKELNASMPFTNNFYQDSPIVV